MTDIPDVAHRARQMYADGETVEAIKKATGLTGHAIYHWLDGGPPEAGLKPSPRRVFRARKITVGERLEMIGRIMRGCDQQISEIERRINPTPTQMDQDSRRLAMISRTLNELTAIDQRNREMTRKKVPPGNDKTRNGDQPVPRNVDELRRSLARKLEAIIAEEDPETAVDPGI